MSILNNSAELAEALDLGSLPTEQQEELLLEISSVVFEGVILRMVEQMDGTTKAAFETLLANEPTDEQVTEFVRQHVPNADGLVSETIADLRDDILSATGSGSE